MYLDRYVDILHVLHGCESSISHPKVTVTNLKRRDYFRD